MHFQILLWDGVSAYDNLHSITFFKKGFKRADVGTGRKANDHAGSQMNDLCAVPHHLFARMLYVPARTTIASRKANQLHFGVRVYAESSFFVPHRSEAFAARTATVAIADNDSNLRV
jgi:hypothetical protein